MLQFFLSILHRSKQTVTTASVLENVTTDTWSMGEDFLQVRFRVPFLFILVSTQGKLSGTKTEKNSWCHLESEDRE